MKARRLFFPASDSLTPVQRLRCCNNRTMTTKQQNYWHIVRDCLVIMHEMSNQDAAYVIQQFTDLVPEPSKNVIYEQEPFWMACSLRQSDLDIREWLPQYIMILAAYDI